MTSIAAIVPLHNKRPHIERALQSIIDQTRAVDELIVIDDASTDGGMDVVRAFMNSHPSAPITCLTRDQPGPGGYAARNLGIESANSEWIAFLDADDEWEPVFLETIARTAEQYGEQHGVIFGSRTIVGLGPKPFLETSHKVTDATVTLDFAEFLELWRALGRCPVWTSATAIRTEDLKAAELFPACRCKRGGDKDTWARVMERTKAVAVPEVVASYHNEVVNQVTKLVSQNQSHCMIPTLEGMLARHAGETRRNLEWLINHEITMYAVRSLGRARLSANLFKGYRVGRAPFTYAGLMLLSVSPQFVQNGLGSLKAWLAARMRR